MNNNEATGMGTGGFSFDGHTALVTGAGSGIGLATAQLLAELGVTVAVTDRDADAAQSGADRIVSDGYSAVAYEMDVTNEAVTDAVINEFADRYGKIDIFVGSAGAGARMPTEEMPTEVWQSVVDVNLTGNFRCARASGRHMLQARSGVIVFVTSVMGLVGGGIYPNPAYQATKGALVNLTRALALDWASRGVRVNSVAPSFARTPLTEKLLSDPDMEREILAATPLGRLVEPREVAFAIAFLASDAAAMITGVTLPIDGGWTAR